MFDDGPEAVNSLYGKSKCHQPVGAEVFDTAPDPTTELPTGSHDTMYLLTCKLPASRSATVPSVPQIGQTLPDIGTAVAHTQAIRSRCKRGFAQFDSSCAHSCEAHT